MSYICFTPYMHEILFFLIPFVSHIEQRVGHSTDTKWAQQIGKESHSLQQTEMFHLDATVEVL